MIFAYGQPEIDYLAARDERLGAVIEQVGHVEREVDPDLFSAVTHHIIGQQISTKAQATVWARFKDAFGEATPRAVASASREELQALGMTFRKADCILDFARRVESGDFDLAAVATLPDAEAIEALTSLKGVGTWTAEMILLFCLQRPDVLSEADAGIQRGMRMVYRQPRIDHAQFEAILQRVSPCGSVASLYFWAVSGGALPELTDPGKAR